MTFDGPSLLWLSAGIDKATVKDLGGWSALSVVEKHYTGEVVEAHRTATRRFENARGVAG
jgi:hypothetical protein